MSLNNLQSIGDDEAITEIDFDSFLNGSDNDFFSDVEKAGANAHKMDEQLQSVLNDTVDNADSRKPAKSSGVRTGFFHHADDNAEGISGLWENPDDYIDVDETQKEVPADTADTAEDINEDAADAPESVDDAQTEIELDEDFERETGLFDIKRDMANLLSQLHESVAVDDAAFSAILHEIESNDAIAPTDIKFSAEDIAAQSKYTEVVDTESVADEEEEEPEYSQYLLVDEESSETEQEPEIAEEKTENQDISAVSDETVGGEQAAVAAALDFAEDNAEYSEETLSDEAEFEEDSFVNPFADESDTAPESDKGKFFVTIPDDDVSAQESGVVNEGIQPLIYYKSDEANASDAPAADNSATAASEGKKKDKKAKKEKKVKTESAAEEKTAEKSKHSDTPRKIVFTAAIITIVICVGYLVNAWVIEPMRFKSQSTELSDVIVSDIVDSGNKTPEEIWSDIRKEHPDVDFPENMLPAYANVYAMNTDLAGWITIDGLDINLPIAQGDNNSYYLYRDIKKNKTKYGVPYFDSRNNIETLNKNTIVYGHNMRHDDLIFGMLEEYRTIDGWRKAPVIQCNTIYGNYSWKIYAVYLADGKTDSEGYFFNYVFTNISDESFAGYIREIDKRKFYTTGVDIEPTDKILTLSTCCYDFDDARLVVVARLVREGESVAVNTAGAYVNENPKYPLLWYKAKGKENIAYKDDEKWRA